MTDDNDVYTPAQFREHIDGHGQRDPDAAPHAGIIQDGKVSRYLAVLDAVYDPAEWARRPAEMPGTSDRLSHVEELRTVGATETGRTAIEGGDMPTLKLLTGDTNQRADISGIKAIGRVDELVGGPAPVLTVLGEMGAGKTEFAKLLGQRWSRLYPDGIVASNIRTLEKVDRWTDQAGRDRDGWIANYPNLKEWLRQDGDPLQNDQTRKLFIADEMSSAASGTGKQGHQTRTKLGPLIFKIRKWGGSLIIIGHDESSIHPLAWRLGTIVKKEAKKKATLWNRIRNGKLKDKVGDPIEGIPASDWGANDKEASSWSWTRATEEEPEISEEEVKRVAIYTAIRAKEQGLSDRDAADYVPYSRTWVNDRWNEYQEESKHVDLVDTVEAVIA
jgi:hypothetical protein